MRAFVLLLSLAACSGGGNLSAAGGQHGPTPPPIRNPYFDPYARPGDVPATWASPVFDTRGTIVHPVDPKVEQGIPDYAHAPWLGGSGASRPAGTF